MSECVDIMRGLKTRKKGIKAKYGKPCIECCRLLPKARPSIMLPQQTCRIHKWHTDPRPALTDDQLSEFEGGEQS